MLLAPRRVTVLKCGVIGTALIFLHSSINQFFNQSINQFLGEGSRSNLLSRAQWHGTILKTDQNVAINAPHSTVRFTKGAISPVPR